LSEQTGRTTSKETLRPTPTQERARARILWCCRTLYHAALQQRITAWTRCHVWLTRDPQQAELQAIRAAMAAYAAIHSPVRHDGLARLDTTAQAFCRRGPAGAGGGRRARGRRSRASFRGRERSPSFTSTQDANAARLENGGLGLSQIGRLAVRWTRPVP